MRSSTQIRRPRPFLWGFEVSGIVAFLMFVSHMTFQPERVLAVAMPFLDPLMICVQRRLFLHYPWMLRSDWIQFTVEFAEIFAVFSVPQLLTALIGGGMARWFWLARSRRRHVGSHGP